jgi:hypothetical protein
MARRAYKIKHNYRTELNPIETRASYYEEVFKDATSIPRTLEYRDIDETFKSWVDKELEVVFEDRCLPTMSLFSNQRFSEYMQSWQYTDENKNILMNFKTVTRENNPQAGKHQGNSWNIPGDRFYTMKREEVLNDNGKISYRDYQVKQPKVVDLTYKVSIVTNKYELINEFNVKIHDKFKARQCYIRPNGHYIPMTLENISDESEYNLDDRTFFSQVYTIKVMGYILTETDFRVIESPLVSLKCVSGLSNGGKRTRPTIELEEDGEIYKCVNGEEDSNYYYQPITLTIFFSKCDDDNVEFTMDCDLIGVESELENIEYYKVKINDEYFENYNFNSTVFYDGEKIRIKIKRDILGDESKIIIRGYNPRVVYDERVDDLEFKEEIKQKPLDLEVN